MGLLNQDHHNKKTEQAAISAPLTKSELENLLEEIDRAYSIYTTGGQVNSDFAEFVSLSIEEFKQALKRPALTARQLRRIVRRAGESYRSQSQAPDWSKYIALYISDTANMNLFD